ncbi:MAG: hydroxypyruvate isomerase family protein [Chitinophagaceae bacterium]
MQRRDVLKTLSLTGVNLAIGKAAIGALPKQTEISLKGNINHSVASWTYNFLSLDELCATVKNIGFGAIDLLPPKDWPTLQKHGLVCSMCYTAGKISLTEGWNNPKNHEWLIKDFTEAIPLVAAAGYKNLICFSGNRNGMDDTIGMKNCADGLKQIMPLAEKHGVIIQMELFNSKIDHKDYMCDKSGWGIELCKMINSPNFKLLFDIYHMQINEGDIIRSIQQNHEYFGHYHTAGVPGRHEIDETQELFYPAIMKAIVATGYKGYVAQEFITTAKDAAEKIDALKKAITICDV